MRYPRPASSHTGQRAWIHGALYLTPEVFVCSGPGGGIDDPEGHHVRSMAELGVVVLASAGQGGGIPGEVENWHGLCFGCVNAVVGVAVAVARADNSGPPLSNLRPPAQGYAMPQKRPVMLFVNVGMARERKIPTGIEY
jgi:hypothetical protein